MTNTVALRIQFTARFTDALLHSGTDIRAGTVIRGKRTAILWHHVFRAIEATLPILKGKFIPAGYACVVVDEKLIVRTWTVAAAIQFILARLTFVEGMNSSRVRRAHTVLYAVTVKNEWH